MAAAKILQWFRKSKPDDTQNEVGTAEQSPNSSRRGLLVAAIDFGTTFSGWAYQFKTEYESDPLKIFTKNWNNGTNISNKTPTTVLIKPDGETFEAFGYQAEDKYAELAENDEHEAWYYFRRFKMKLYNAKSITLDMKIGSENGKKLPALTIFSLVISSLKKDLMEECSKTIVGGIHDSDVLWVLTVPAIWNDGAKQFMREAGIKAGIQSNKLMIALEPEAASVYCKQASLDIENGLEGATEATFSPGTKYIVLDAGGGTIDINVHQVRDNNNLRELYKPTGSKWGGIMVDQAFEDLLSQIFGHALMEQFKHDSMDDYLSLFRTFEVKKRDISKKNISASVFPLSVSFVDLCKTILGMEIGDVLSKPQFANSITLARGNKLKISASVMQRLYSDSTKKVVKQLDVVLRDTRVKGCQTILMVGGYSEARLLREEIKRKFPKMSIVIPNESSLVVLKGAVLYGRNPQVIASRVCKYTYGMGVLNDYDPKIHPESRMFVDKDGEKMVDNVFRKVVEVGQEVLRNQPCVSGSGGPSTKYGICYLIICRLYASPDPDPKYTDESGCFEVGRFMVNCRDKHGKTSQAKQELMLGGTEIEIRTVLKTTGEEARNTIRLPD